MTDKHEPKRQIVPTTDQISSRNAETSANILFSILNVGMPGVLWAMVMRLFGQLTPYLPANAQQVIKRVAPTIKHIGRRILDILTLLGRKIKEIVRNAVTLKLRLLLAASAGAAVFGVLEFEFGILAFILHHFGPPIFRTGVLNTDKVAVSGALVLVSFALGFVSGPVIAVVLGRYVVLGGLRTPLRKPGVHLHATYGHGDAAYELSTSGPIQLSAVVAAFRQAFGGNAQFPSSDGPTPTRSPDDDGTVTRVARIRAKPKGPIEAIVPADTNDARLTVDGPGTFFEELETQLTDRAADVVIEATLRARRPDAGNITTTIDALETPPDQGVLGTWESDTRRRQTNKSEPSAAAQRDLDKLRSLRDEQFFGLSITVGIIADDAARAREIRQIVETNVEALIDQNHFRITSEQAPDSTAAFDRLLSPEPTTTYHRASINDDIMWVATSDIAPFILLTNDSQAGKPTTQQTKSD